MTRREIDKQLRGMSSWALSSGRREADTERLRKAFTRHMRGRHYGFDALYDAWAWFSSGWQARGSAR